MNQNPLNDNKDNKSFERLLSAILPLLIAVGISIDLNLSELKLKIEQENPIFELIQKFKHND